MRAFAWLGLASMVACSSTRDSSSDLPQPRAQRVRVDPVTGERTFVAEPSLVDRWACQADADCTNSCLYGAVIRAWREGMQRDCEDGCADVEAAAPRCEAGSCVAYRKTPERRREECTRRAEGKPPH